MDDSQDHVSIDGLEKSLADLMEVADATELNKGYGGVSVETSGRYDEKGKGGGGMAGSGDVGGLDDMMIAKMSDAGVPAGMIAEFSAFMAGKQEDDEEDDEGEESEKSFYEDDFDYGYEQEDIAKSMDHFRADPAIADTIDVSPYLESLTVGVADQIDGLTKSQQVFQLSQNEVNRHMAAAMAQMGTMIKSQAAVIEELGSRLGLVERQPSAPRAALTTGRAQAMAKSMPNEAGNGYGSQLTKSELKSTLTYMNLEKGIKSINGRSTSEIVCLYEGGAPIDGKVVEAAQRFLQTNPHEADAARSYA